MCAAFFALRDRRIDGGRDGGLGDGQERGQRLGPVGDDDRHTISRFDAERPEARGATGHQARQFGVGRMGAVGRDQSDRVRVQACGGLNSVENP